MLKKINKASDVKNLYIQVTSDAIVTPQLRMLGVASKYADQRPAFGSAIVYELYQHEKEPEKYVVRYCWSKTELNFCRILYNGHTLKSCGNKGYCTWEEWTEKITKFFPAKEACQPFYNNYQ